MTDDKQAVKTLAEQLVKAMKSVSANTPSRNYSGGTSPGTIQASKIVGLPAAFSSIINGIESSAAGGDPVAQQTLSALNHIAAGEFETITADTAMIEKIYATFGEFITLVAEDAQIGSLDVETIRAGLADVGLINIGSATISTAQIQRLSTGTAFVREEIGGKVYIDDLAVSDANIVSLAAGTVLINNSNGELVELYVDATTGDVSTRAVSYDGSDIINQSSLSGNTIINNTLSGDAVITNSLNGSKIISNSITTAQLNASEIFAAQGTIMDLIADNINVTTLFANTGFINKLQSTIISSDLSENDTVVRLTDSIDLLASNSSRTFVQEGMPIPVHENDTWFDPITEEHYVSNEIILPISQMVFGHDDNGNLCNGHSDDYHFSLNLNNGELTLLLDNEDAEKIKRDNNIDFNIVNDRLYANGLWNKIDNVAFSELKVSVDGIVSEVYDSDTGLSRIQQNSGQIYAVVSGDTAVPYVETSSVRIKNDNVEIKSTGDVDIKASNFSISFNTAGALDNRSRVDISNDVGIKVSDSYGNYFQATSNKIGLYDIQGTPRLYMNNNGQAFFNGSLTLGGANNINGALTIRNSNGDIITSADNSGLSVYNSTGAVRQFYIDSTTGNATFGGSLNAASGTFNGFITLGGSANGSMTIRNANGDMIGSWNSGGIEVYNSTGAVRQFYIDSSTGNATFGGSLNAASGTFNGSLTLGGSTNGLMTIKNTNGATIGTWGSGGIEVRNSTGAVRQFYIDSSTGNATFGGSLNAASGTFNGSLTLGGSTNGSMTIKNANGATIGTWGSGGIEVFNNTGAVKQFYIDSTTGNATFGGVVSLGGTVDGSMIIKNANGATIGAWGSGGIEVRDRTGTTKQFYIDNTTGNATFGGQILLGGSVGGAMTIKNANNATIGSWDSEGIKIYNGSGAVIGLWGSGGIQVYNRTGRVPQFYIDSNTGNATFAGNLSAAGGTFAGTLSAAKGTFEGTLSASCITSGKLTATYIDATNLEVNAINIKGELTSAQIATGAITGDKIEAGTITGNKIKTGTITADKIKGGTLVLGGLNDANGKILIKDGGNNNLMTLDSNGLITGDGLTGLINRYSKLYSANKSGFITYSPNKYYYVNILNRDIIFFKDHYQAYKNIYLGKGKEMWLNNGANLTFYNLVETAIDDIEGTVLSTIITSTRVMEVQDDGIWALKITTPGNISANSLNVTDSIFSNHIIGYTEIHCNNNITAAGDITANGTKSRVVSTSQYSDRLLYCYETPSPMFGDIGEGVISEDGMCYISLDPVFAQTISTNQYQVFLQCYSEGNCYVSERLGSYFVVSGTPGLKFGWEIKAKQSDFDQLRLERNDEKFSVPSQNYGEEAADYVKRIYDGRVPKNSGTEIGREE